MDSVESILAHVPALRRYARLLTGNAARADDLVQDTLERACRKWALWRPGGHLRAWLLSMMHNLHLNHVRDWRHDEQHLDLDEVPEPTHEPLRHAAERMDLQQALLKLHPAHREVLLLVVVEEYAYAEAAGILGVPLGTVMSRLHRARVALRHALEPAGTAPTPSSSAEGADVIPLVRSRRLP